MGGGFGLLKTLGSALGRNKTLSIILVGVLVALLGFIANFSELVLTSGTSRAFRLHRVPTGELAQVFFHIPHNQSSLNVNAQLTILKSYQPTVRPIVYSVSDVVCNAAKQAAVDCVTMPLRGTPAALFANLLKFGIYLHAGGSRMVGFVHSDVVFLSGLSMTVAAVASALEHGEVRPHAVLVGRVAHAPNVAGLGAPWSAWAQRGERSTVSAQQLWGELHDTATGATQHGFVLAARAAAGETLLPASGRIVRASTPSELAALLAAPRPGRASAQVLDVSASVHAVHFGRVNAETLQRVPTGRDAAPAVDMDTLQHVTALSARTGRVTVRTVKARKPLTPATSVPAAAPVVPSAEALAAKASTVPPAPSRHPLALPSTQPSASAPAVVAASVPPAPAKLYFKADEAVTVLPHCAGNHSWGQRAVVRDLIPTRTHCLPGETGETLLTAFTTLMMRGKADMSDANTAQKVLIQRNVLRGLAALSPEVRTVVFTDSAVFREMAEGLGMVVVSDVRSSSFGLPFIKAMYEWVEARTSAPLHGFMNGDILFGPGLIELLQSTLGDVEQGTVQPRVLLTGRRFNVQMPLPLAESHSDIIPVDVTREDLAERVKSFRKRGEMFMSNAQDYFYITRGAWEWDEIPDFVPGRAAYDNWLVDHSYRDQVESVDVTRCVFAIHQSGSDGHKAGLSRARAEPDWNFKQMTPYIGRYDRGHTTHCNIELRCPQNGTRIALHRVPERQRSGERGPPWTGIKYVGHVDPLTKKKWVCQNPPPHGVLARPEHNCIEALEASS